MVIWSNSSSFHCMFKTHGEWIKMSSKLCHIAAMTMYGTYKEIPTRLVLCYVLWFGLFPVWNDWPWKKLYNKAVALARKFWCFKSGPYSDFHLSLNNTSQVCFILLHQCDITTIWQLSGIQQHIRESSFSWGFVLYSSICKTWPQASRRLSQQYPLAGEHCQERYQIYPGSTALH